MREAIDILEKIKLKSYFKEKECNKTITLRMKKGDLIDFCIKLLKIIIEDEERDLFEEGEEYGIMD